MQDQQVVNNKNISIIEGVVKTYGKNSMNSSALIIVTVLMSTSDISGLSTAATRSAMNRVQGLIQSLHEGEYNLTMTRVTKEQCFHVLDILYLHWKGNMMFMCYSNNS